jgi:RNA polymerase sigma-70 factor, ECF subfamily
MTQSTTMTGGLPATLRGMLEQLETASAGNGQRWILAILREHSARIIGILWRMLGREQDVLDAYQNVVCHFAARGPRRVGRNRAAYFYRSAINAGIEMIRHRRHERERLPTVAERYGRASTTPDFQEDADQHHTVDRMRAAILSLPEQLRSVVVLRDLSGMNYRRVSTIMKISPGTARVYRRQAVVRLSHRLAREVPA